MTTEHERALSNAHRVNDILREECTEFELQRVAARLALAERDAEISALKVTINNMTAGLRQTRDEYEAEIAKLKADNHWPIAELPDCMMPDGAEPCDGFKSLQAELVETRRQLQQAEEELTRFKTPGYLSGKLNPFPERLPATQATEIAEKLIRAYLLDVGAGIDDFTQHEVEFSEKIAAAISGELNPFPERSPGVPTDDELTEAIKPLWLATKPSREAQEIRSALAVSFDDRKYKQWMSDFVPDYVWDLVDIAAQRAFNRVQSPPSASALEIAERFRLFFLRPYPMSEEGVERAVQALAQEIEAAIRHNEARPGTAALEATRDLFQSIEGWRPTDDWTGVPPRLKLMFDRTLHAIEGAEARGRAEAFLAGEECAVDNVLAILDEEGWLGQTKHRVRALVTKEPSA